MQQSVYDSAANDAKTKSDLGEKKVGGFGTSAATTTPASEIKKSAASQKNITPQEKVGGYCSTQRTNLVKWSGRKI